MADPLPFHINLLVMVPKYANAWKAALDQYGIADLVHYTVHEASLSGLESDVKFDLIVSPANSYAILDGGFDDAISRALSLRTDYAALTRHCQSIIYDKYRGFQPPGSCVIIRIPDELRTPRKTRNVWGVEYIGHCPTMRTPSDCCWDREVVYECIWCLLCEIDKHNRSVQTDSDGRKIESILMTPMATGTGGVSAEKWASQAALAIKHYMDALGQQEAWKAMNWPAAGQLADEVAETHDL